MEIREKDRIDEALEIMAGIKGLCVILEECRDPPRTAYIVIKTALNRAEELLRGIRADSIVHG